MQRILLAGLLVLAPTWLAAQAAPLSHTPHRARHHARLAANQPPPTAAPPRPAPADGQFVAAPTPNPDIGPPNERPLPAVAVQPEILQEHVVQTGQGYTYGSTPEAIQNADTAKAPGVGMTIPMR